VHTAVVDGEGIGGGAVLRPAHRPNRRRPDHPFHCLPARLGVRGGDEEAQLAGDVDDQRRARRKLAPLTAGIPLNRAGVDGARGLPEDIAGAAYFLLSPDSDFITGEFLSVNGGVRTGS